MPHPVCPACPTAGPLLAMPRPTGAPPRPAVLPSSPVAALHALVLYVATYLPPLSPSPHPSQPLVAASSSLPHPHDVAPLATCCTTCRSGHAGLLAADCHLATTTQHPPGSCPPARPDSQRNSSRRVVPERKNEWLAGTPQLAWHRLAGSREASVGSGLGKEGQVGRGGGGGGRGITG